MHAEKSSKLSQSRLRRPSFITVHKYLSHDVSAYEDK